jgi:hypothetical protein
VFAAKENGSVEANGCNAACPKDSRASVVSESRVLHELGKTFFSTEFMEFTKFGSEACAMAEGVILDQDHSCHTILQFC